MLHLNQYNGRSDNRVIKLQLSYHLFTSLAANRVITHNYKLSQLYYINNMLTMCPCLWFVFEILAMHP